MRTQRTHTRAHTRVNWRARADTDTLTDKLTDTQPCGSIATLCDHRKPIRIEIKSY